MDYNEVNYDLQAPSTSGTSSYRSTGSGSDSRLLGIFEQEIDREIAEKMGAIAEIADNIKKCQQSLDRLRKEAVNKYFMEYHQDIECDEQPSIHPAVKKLIGKRPRNVSQTENFMSSTLNQWKRETRKRLLKNSLSKHKSPKEDQLHTKKSKLKGSMSDPLIKPQYVPPNIPGNPQENSSLRGNTKKLHMRVLIGNVAKEIQSEGDIFDPATHKWMVYVRSAPGSLAVDREVARVHFFLHPSYKPHDIVTVPSPPFTLNRRGWGEFPMRVQLHFKNRLNKPADIIHHLKLNGARSGHHTRSAETFADLWVYPYQKHHEKKNKKDSGSEVILTLASDMLKEEVPDFTSEVICSRCQTTSQGTNSHSCTCNLKVNTQESCVDHGNSNGGYSESSSGETDSSDSEDSAVNTVIPKPIPCWQIQVDTNIAEIPEDLLEEAVKEEYASDTELKSESTDKGFEVKISSSALDGNDNIQLKENNVFENKESVKSMTEEEVVNNSLSTGCFSLASNSNNLVKVGFNILDVEASDIMDALEIKQEVKEEPQKNFESFNARSSEGGNPTAQNSNSSSVKSEPKGSITQSSNDLSSLTPNHTADLFSYGDNVIMEEVPIDEFINNIVEEEIVVDVPQITSEETIPKEIVSDVLEATLADTTYSVGNIFQESLLNTTKNVPCSNEIVKNKQANAIVNKLKETTPTLKSVVTPTATALTGPKEVIKQNVIPNIEQPLKTTLIYKKVQPIQFLKSVTEKTGISTKSSGYLVENEPVKLSSPRQGVTVVKSPKYISITKDLLSGKSLIHNATHILKKPKLDLVHQATNSKEENLLVPQGSLLIKSSQAQNKSEKINDSQLMNSFIRTAVNNNINNNQVNTKSTSLLKPQFRGNTLSKSNLKNTNPNSLLRPTLAKPTIINSNFSNLKVLSKSVGHVLPNSRPLTYSVLKAVKNASEQPKIKVHSSLLDSVEESTKKLTTQNCTKRIVTAQPLPQIQNSATSLKVNQLIYDPGCNLATSTNKVTFNQSLGLELLRSSNNLCNKNPESPSRRETNSSTNFLEICDTKDKISVNCSTPKSFTRQSYSSVSQPRETNQKKNYLVKNESFEQNVDQQNNPLCKVVVPDTISFNELIKIIHFPKASIPSRPVMLNSGVCEKKEVKISYLDCVLSCNNLHSDLKQTHLAQPESQFGRKSVIVNKDQVNSVVNDQILYYLEQLRLLVNTCTFPETELAVRWLVRGLPLVLSEARLVAFKIIHPYCAISKEVYCSWPSFKQAAAEWLRAKTVVRILSALHTKGILREAVWSTKTVYWWCRTHGYSPAFCLIGPENTPVSNTDWIQKLGEKTSPTKVLEWMASVRHKVRSIPEEDVDVVTLDSQEDNLRNSEIRERASQGDGGDLICGRPWVQDMHSYVLNQVESLGQEPLVAGGRPQSVTATLLSHIAVVLAEDMLRRGLANAARRGAGRLEARDVCQVILKRQEFEIFTGQGLEIDETFRENLKSLISSKNPA